VEKRLPAVVTEREPSLAGPSGPDGLETTREEFMAGVLVNFWCPLREPAVMHEKFYQSVNKSFMHTTSIAHY